MSTFTKYYEANQDENPYRMSIVQDSSRVKIIASLVKEATPKGGAILDVGCGDMFLASLLPEYTYKGIDINLHFNNSKAIKHDLEAFPYPFPKESFDTIICSETLEHLFDPISVTKELYRLLKPLGVYILSTPNHDFIDYFITHYRGIKFDPLKSWTKEHIHSYNIESHDAILAEARFKRVFYSGADPHGGVFFQEARVVLSRFLQDSLKLDLSKAQEQTDLLLSEMFKDWMHTTVIKAVKR